MNEKTNETKSDAEQFAQLQAETEQITEFLMNDVQQASASQPAKDNMQTKAQEPKPEDASAKGATSLETKTGAAKVPRWETIQITPAKDGKNLDMILSCAGHPEQEIRIVAPKVKIQDSSFLTVDPIAEMVSQSEKIQAKSLRPDLENVYAAFFARWEDWSMSSRFQMKGNLWIFLHSVTEAIKRDGLNTDPELLELASFAVRACRDLETERLSDLDELEEKIGSVEDIMILNRKRSVVVEEDLDALSPDKPEIF